MPESQEPSNDESSQPEPHESEWYAQGLRFACSQCGNCCTGPEGAVWFNDEEGRRMAAHLDISVGEFYKLYARKLGDEWSLNENLTDHGYDCVFLDRDTVPGKAVCSLYQSRPTQCSTWPFWPENLSSKRAWAMAKHDTPCPGMDTGKLIPIESIRLQRDGTPPDPELAGE